MEEKKKVGKAANAKENARNKFTLKQLFQSKGVEEGTAKFKSVNIKEFAYHEKVVNLLRKKYVDRIEDFLESCQRIDHEKSGKIKIAIFIMLLSQNVSELNEELLVMFESELKSNRKSDKIEYQSFFDEYLFKKKDGEKEKRKRDDDVNIN